MELFSFINDKKIRKMCESDFEELEKIKDLKLSKAPLILIGGLVESILYYSIASNKDYSSRLKNFDKRNEKSITLEQLLADALNVNLITNETFQNLKTIQTYRNSIHPNVYIKMENDLNSNIVNNAYYALLELIRIVSIDNRDEITQDINSIFNDLFSRNPDPYERYLYGAFLKKYSKKVVIELMRKEILK